MNERWLRPNHRILLVAAVVAIMTVVAGLLVRALEVSAAGEWFAVGLTGTGLVMAGWAARAALRSRIALSGRSVTVASGLLSSARLPLADVEAFFLGQGPVVLPLVGQQSARCTNLVVRLAQRAVDLHDGDVASWVGDWSDGYFAIRGTWCEPLDAALVVGLNERLARAKQSRAEDGSPS